MSEKHKQELLHVLELGDELATFLAMSGAIQHCGVVHMLANAVRFLATENGKLSEPKSENPPDNNGGTD